MTTNLDALRSDLDSLLKAAMEIEKKLVARYIESQKSQIEQDSEVSDDISFERNYQSWYSQAKAVIKQLLPDRLSEFENLYMRPPPKGRLDFSNFTIQLWLRGSRAGSVLGEKEFHDLGCIAMLFQNQIGILEAATTRFTSSLYDIRQIVQADLFNSELDASRELVKKGFLRGGGAMAGVVLEKHLEQVAKNHNLSLRKKHPTISDWNDFLKEKDIYQVKTWRWIQRLGDLRNQCDHKKDKDPTKDELEELISGVEKATKTLF